MTGISIVICSYNGRDRLADTLAGIAKQQCAQSVELILVDNNSSDGTIAFADDWWATKGNQTISYRSFFEPKPGKTYAQEVGIAQSRYSYILICDDDNILDRDYLSYCFAFMENHPEVGMLGGQGVAKANTEKPSWFELYQLMYAVGPQSEETGDITYKKGYVYGAGSMIRKAVWEGVLQAGVELQMSCRKGDKLVSGGDNEMGYLIAASGYRIYWDPKLIFQHVLPDDRLTLDYVKRMRIGYAITYECLKSYRSALIHKKTGRTRKKMAKDLVSSIRSLLKYWLNWNRMDKTDPEFVLDYYFVKYRAIEIIKNWRSYPVLWDQIEKNLSLVSKRP